MKKIILSILAILFIVIACKNEETQPLDTFYQNYYEVNVLPALTNFKTDIEAQIVYSEQFKENNTFENFEKLQNQWRVTATSYAKTRVYDFGEIKSLFYGVNIYNFPVNTTTIENIIDDKNPATIESFATKSTTIKGLGTLEYLLFNNQNSTEAYNLLSQDSFRIYYLLGVSQEVLNQIDSLIAFWENGYKTEFANSNGNVCTDNARCLAFNQLINVLDVNKVTKIGKPAGLEKSDNLAPTLLEAYRSETSLALIKASLQEIEHVYSGSEVNFESIVDNIDTSKELSNQIALSFTNVYANIEAISTSLYTAITQENIKVETLYNSLTILNNHFSVDGASLLSVTVLPTDNDGD